MSPRKLPPSVTEPVLTLDLGSASLRLALVVDRRPQVLSFPAEGGRVPTAFGFDPHRTNGGALVLGDAARRLAITEPRTVLLGGLRLAGRRYELAGVERDHWRQVRVERGPGADVQLGFGGERWPIPRLLAALIQSVVEQVERERNLKLERALVSVAPGSDDARRRALVHALCIAGFEHIELVHSTTAAALAWSTLEREGAAALGIAGLEAALAGARGPSVTLEDDETGDDETGDDETGDDESGEDETGEDETGDDEAGDDETGDDEADDDAPETSTAGHAAAEPDKRDQLLLLLDLGAASFDAALARFDGPDLELLASRSLPLGGDELDERIVEWLLGQFEDANEVDLSDDPIVRARMRDVAEKAKIALSDVERHEIRLPFLWADASGPKHSFVTLERERFERMIRDVADATAALAASVLADAGVTADELDAVVMLGGSARVPLLQDRIESLLGRVPETELGTAALDEDFVVRGLALDVVRRSGRRPSSAVVDIAGRELWLHAAGAEQRLVERSAPRPLSRTIALSLADGGGSFELLEADDDERAPCMRGRISADAKQVELRVSLDGDGRVSCQVQPASASLVLSQRVGLGVRALERLRREAGARARLALAQRRNEALRGHLQALLRANEGWLAETNTNAIDELLRTSLTQWGREAEAALEHGSDELLRAGIDGFDALRDAIPNKLRVRAELPELPAIVTVEPRDEAEQEPLGDPADDYDVDERVDVFDDAQLGIQADADGHSDVSLDE